MMVILSSRPWADLRLPDLIIEAIRFDEASVRSSYLNLFLRATGRTSFRISKIIRNSADTIAMLRPRSHSSANGGAMETRIVPINATQPVIGAVKFLKCR